MSSKLLLGVFFIYLFALCTVSAQQPEPRIVGGYNVTSINGFRHQVSIRLIANERDGFGRGHICGGSLIGNRTVLTAAHCVYDSITKKYSKASSYVVAMGGLQRYVRDNNTIYYGVSRINGHKSFKYNTFENDIAILILDQDVPLNHPTAQPIALSTQNHVVGQSCVISGWGTTKYENGTQPASLLAVNLIINSRAACNQPNRHSGSVKIGMFCAGPFAGGIDSCQGDSGGKCEKNASLINKTAHP